MLNSHPLWPAMPHLPSSTVSELPHMQAGGEQEEVWGAGFADDMRLYNSTLRGAQKSCDITADFHGVMGLEMACGKCWVRVLEWDEQGERVQRSTEEKAPHERVWYRRVESEEGGGRRQRGEGRRRGRQG